MAEIASYGGGTQEAFDRIGFIWPNPMATISAATGVNHSGGRQMWKWIGVLTACMALGCVKTSTVVESPPTANVQAQAIPTVTSAADVQPNLGKVVRATVSVGEQRAKLGDMVRGKDFSFFCLGHPLPDEVLGTTITVQGKVMVRKTGAVQSPDGSWSQGTAPGQTDLVMEGCKVVK